MDLVIAVVLAVGGAPLGGLLLLIGLVGQFWNPSKKPRIWPAILMIIGVLLLIAAASMYSALSQTNFSL
ncbi:hypothetical protein Q4555_11960 [Octadecabacter sp. 1_MG-2023]|uniref:hypothetical protein n=1 Tax=unclassified Octadecabacter TaxID=196158 RepID=UPI001C09DD52|nr:MULTISPECIES: hypothetical protein [unclassified Octadecabacter]MBU2993770.1 hypothetical protein [Octadecabacter sp. B2R22]MDO6735385.1 hypothetical protein [Octadecabacter sp. 1_MG-2023]